MYEAIPSFEREEQNLSDSTRPQRTSPKTRSSLTRDETGRRLAIVRPSVSRPTRRAAANVDCLVLSLLSQLRRTTPMQKPRDQSRISTNNRVGLGSAIIQVTSRAQVEFKFDSVVFGPWVCPSLSRPGPVLQICYKYHGVRSEVMFF